MAAGTGDLERRQHHVRRRDAAAARDLELRQRGTVGADEHHVHRQPAAAFLHEVPFTLCEDLPLRTAGREVLEEDPEALLVDARSVAYGLDLEVALDGARMVERLV